MKKSLVIMTMFAAACALSACDWDASQVRQKQSLATAEVSQVEAVKSEAVQSAPAAGTIAVAHVAEKSGAIETQASAAGAMASDPPLILGNVSTNAKNEPLQAAAAGVAASDPPPKVRRVASAAGAMASDPPPRIHRVATL